LIINKFHVNGRTTCLNMSHNCQKWKEFITKKILNLNHVKLDWE